MEGALRKPSASRVHPCKWGAYSHQCAQRHAGNAVSLRTHTFSLGVLIVLGVGRWPKEERIWGSPIQPETSLVLRVYILRAPLLMEKLKTSGFKLLILEKHELRPREWKWLIGIVGTKIVSWFLMLCHLVSERHCCNLIMKQKTETSHQNNGASDLAKHTHRWRYQGSPSGPLFSSRIAAIEIWSTTIPSFSSLLRPQTHTAGGSQAHGNGPLKGWGDWYTPWSLPVPSCPTSFQG